MKYLIGIIGLLFIMIPCIAQKHSRHNATTEVIHILNAFNGMQAGFNADGSPNRYVAQVTKLTSISLFTPQDNASTPKYNFGYVQMFYNKSEKENPIQLTFSLPPNQDFIVTLTITTNVENSTFDFELVGDSCKTKIAEINGPNILPVRFKGSGTGNYGLIINPMKKPIDSATFLLTEIKINSISKK
jgi:hypothetical protein